MEISDKIHKDKKTFNIVKTYIDDIKKHIDLLQEDFRIQEHEMRKYAHDTHEKPEKWVEKYAKGERAYLNALKFILNGFIVFDKKLTWRSFCKVVDNYNKYYNDTIKKIY